jgi:Mg2+/Co2+ transporter CorB
VIIPAVLVAALAMAAVRIYWSSSWGFMLAAALIAFLVIILPLTAAVEKTSYVSALLVWLVCALTLTFILVLEKPVVDSFQRGVKKGSLIKKQQDFYKELEKK